MHPLLDTSPSKTQAAQPANLQSLLNHRSFKLKEVTITLPVESVNAILQTLGQLPTSSGAFPLMVEIKKQADEQMKSNEPIPQVQL
jgi:hypothetical protein